jgi:Short C-terminal domain
MAATGFQGMTVTVLAAAPGPKAPVRAPEGPGQFLYPGLYLVGALLLGAAVIAVVGRWRQRSAVESPSASDQLAQFRALYDKGEISREEFERLRAHLGGQLLPRRQPPAAAPAAAPPAPDGPAANGPPPPDGIRPA